MVPTCKFLMCSIILMIVNDVSSELKLSRQAYWDQNGITVAGQKNGTAGSSLTQLDGPVGIHITDQEILYIGEEFNHRILVVHLNSSIKNFAIGFGPGVALNQFNEPHDVFVFNKSLYVTDTKNKRIQRISLNGSNPATAANLAGSKQPFYLYVNNEGNIYVSDRDEHCIWLFLSNSTIGQIIAGKNEDSGSNDDQFNEPYGIFVNDAGIMYIADRQNHRIMKWLPGASQGIRVAGDGNAGDKATQLNKPTYVIVDANEYMYISEAGDQGRIIRWLVGSWYGVCIVACTGSFGTATNQLKGPHSLAFDRNGSLYVADWDNHRVQKFQILSYSQSFNQPIVPTNSKWSSCGITFASQSLVGSEPRGIFIDSHDTVYVVDHTHGQILIWSKTNNKNPRKISTGKLFAWTGLFVTTNGDIYVENDNQTGQIDKWTLNATRGDPISKFSGNCYALFLDVKNDLYCSINLRHIVVKISLNNGRDKTESTAAGENDKSGSSEKSLSHPVGIFVDVHCNLYVADGRNNRIQLFPSEESNGITVAGNGIPNGLQLQYPSGIIVDADNILYIADNQKHRVVRVVGRYHFRCLVGCSEKSGSESTQLHYSYSVRFDSSGNLYVADEANRRIQKFIIGVNSCETSTIISSTLDFSISNRLTTIKQESQKTASEISVINYHKPIVELIPSGSLLTFRQNQHIYISSIIRLNYTDSTSIETKWSIFICTSTCSSISLSNHSISTIYKDLSIPSRTLPYGFYRLKLTVTMNEYSIISLSSLVDIQIISSSLITNLISYNTQSITHDYQQDLIIFDPGQFSYDQMQLIFNANDWHYFYYCRTYPEDLQGFQLFNNQNHSCFQNAFQYLNANNSSVKIFTNLLHLNRTYQFMVQMIHRQNSSLHSFSYLIVRFEHMSSPVITIRCVIATMCISSNEDFHYVNRNTQLLLLSSCSGNCATMDKISWKIYKRSNQTNQWIPFKSFEADLFFAGLNTKKLTVMKDLFIEHLSNIYWRFEVIYSSSKSENESHSYFDVEVNQPPYNGYCLIHPVNGTITTLFTIQCTDWLDQDEIKDYLIYGYKSNSTEETFFTHTALPIIYLYLPMTIDPTSPLQLKVKIRDIFDCDVEYHLPSVHVHPDLSNISQFIDLVHSNHTKDQNIFFQMVTSIAQLFHQMNQETANEQIQNGIPLTQMAITPLHYQSFHSMTNTSNHSFLLDTDEQIKIREDLLMIVSNLSAVTLLDLQLQSSILTQLTQTTNQLTRTASMLASNKCFQLSSQLKSIANKLPLEDTHFIATHLLQCAVNSFNGVYGSLQERATILRLDLLRTFNTEHDDEINLNERNQYYQKQTAKKISNQFNEIISSITSMFHLHLNQNQQILINTSTIIFSLEQISFSSLLHRLNYSQIHYNETVFIRTILQPLASPGYDHQFPAFTNLSRSFSLSILHENGTELNINTNLTNPIQFFIPRDPQMIISSALVQNSTLINEKKESSLPFYYYLFHLQQTNPNLTFAIHLEIHPSIANISYLLTYQFDSLKPSLPLSDHWVLVCPSSNYHFLDNYQTSNHHSIIYGLRQLSTQQIEDFCFYNKTFSRNSPLLRQSWSFTSDYQIRMYQSACFYLDFNNNWQSDGLLVGPLTNHYETQCFSTRV
ncbi:hypothetical protein I4U23_011571 [Adineta vaga]|nr:hypothetical protein I4U23_011571 [Adineta vaga]